MSDLNWVEIEETDRPTKRAVRLTPKNAQAIADHFDGTVQTLPRNDMTGRMYTRVNIKNWSAPAYGWVTDDGRHLDDCQWREAQR